MPHDFFSHQLFSQIMHPSCLGTPGTASGSRSRRAKSVPSRASSITGLLFQDSHSLISCGAGDG